MNPIRVSVNTFISVKPIFTITPIRPENMYENIKVFKKVS